MAARFGLAVVAAGVLLAAAGAFIETRRQADAAWRTYREATRAWVDVSVRPRSVRLEWMDRYEVLVMAGVDAATTGLSPALDLNLALVARENPPGAAFSDIRRSCLAHRSHDVLVGFPGSTSHRFRQRDLHLAITYLDRTTGDTKEKNLANATVLLIVVCATYRIVGDGELHVTGRMFELQAVDPAKPSINPISGYQDGRPIWTGENLSGDDILVEPIVAGNTAD